MTEQILQQQEQQEQHKEALPNPIETRAKEMGWKEKEFWTGAEEDFIDAKEFVRRKPLFDKIDDLSKSVKRLRQAQEAMVEHNGRLKEAEFKRALEYLQANRKQAMIEGETEKALEFEDKILDIQKQQDEFKETQTSLQQVQQEPSPHPMLVSWKQQNSWYQNDNTLTLFADALGKDLHSKGRSPEEILQEISQAVKREFPHKFKNPQREKPGVVETNNRSTVNSNSVEAGMSDDEKRIMNTILRSTKSLTKEKYLEQFKAIKGV